MSVAKLRDELWIEVKCQTNPEIAGSPRNAFRCSPGVRGYGGRALIELGGEKLTKLSQTANAVAFQLGSETAGAKLRRREGNSPDHRLRPLRAG